MNSKQAVWAGFIFMSICNTPNIESGWFSYNQVKPHIKNVSNRLASFVLNNPKKILHNGIILYNLTILFIIFYQPYAYTRALAKRLQSDINIFKEQKTAVEKKLKSQNITTLEILRNNEKINHLNSKIKLREIWLQKLTPVKKAAVKPVVTPSLEEIRKNALIIRPEPVKELIE